MQTAATTSAGAGVTAGFEIDGNASVEGAGTDWTSPGIAPPTTDPVKTADDSNFTGGSKEFQNPSDWKEGTGTSTDQGDISDVYSHFVTGSSTWAFLGFRRVAQSGTMTFMAELNQKANLPKEAGDSVLFRPDRSVNDLLLRFEQDGNGNFALTAAYKWTQSASGTFVSGCFLVPGYATASAWCPTPTAGASFDGATGENKLFAEAAVNLSSFDTVGDCRGAYGVMNVRSFAGDSESSSLLDFVGGIGISVPPTCGKLVIEKRDQFQRLVPGATFRVTKNPIPGATGAAAAELVVTDGGTPGVDTVADGVVTIDPAKPGTYTVEEIATPAGYAPDTTVHTGVVVGSSGTSVATVKFTNKLFFKPLAVANQASGSYGVAYDWRVHKTVVGDATKTIEEGAITTFQYRVELEALPEGPATGKEVHGTVTVTNLNPAATHPSMRATIGIAGDLACHFLPSNAAVDVDPGTTGVQVDAAAGATSYDYACDPGAGALVAGTTTATVSWDKATYPQKDVHPGNAAAAATYAITVQPKVDEHAMVTDSFDGGVPVPIGLPTYAWTDVWNAADHRVVVATYSSPAVGGTAGACRSYGNVARVDESDTDDFDTSGSTVEVCVDLDDLVVTKTAKPAFARDYDWTIEKSVKGSSSQTVDEGTPASFGYDVVVTPSISGDGQFVVTGVISVQNPNQTTISGVQLTDSLPAASCTIDKPAGSVSVPKGTSTFDYSCVLPGATASTTGTNTATASWDKAAYYGTSGSASGQAGFDFADAKPTVTDATATVTDTQVDLDGTSPDGVVVEAVDGPRTFTYTKAFDGVPGECTTYDNTAKVVAVDSKTSDSDTETVKVCVDLDDLVVTKTAKPAFARDYDWTIEKSVKGASSQTVPQGTPASFAYDVVVTPSAAKDTAFVVAGAISVHNPNQTTISGVQLTDSLPGGQCTIDKPAGPLSIQKGTSTFDYSCVLPGATPTTTGTNTATASWDKAAYHGTSGSASGTAGVDFAQATVVVTDATATVTDTQVQLGDVPGGAVVKASDGPRTFTYTKAFDGVPGTCTTYDNTAKVVATDSKESDTDDATVEVCVQQPLRLAATAKADLAVDHAWSITKVADATQRTADANGNATFTYTVTARAGARTESGWRLQGEVAITNPNQYAAGDVVADVTASTDLGGGAVCTVTGGSDVTVAEDSSTTLPVACTFATQPAGSGTLSVTATWDPPGAATSTSVTATTQPLTFGVRSETNRTVQVVDDKTVAGQRVVLDPALTWAAGLVRSYTYSLTLAGGAPGACRSWTNTATVDQPVGTDPTASAAVLVCTPATPPPPVVVPPPVVPPVVPPEVLPEQAFGKAVGSVRASCQGTVRARLANRTGEKVVYTLRVGTKVHRISVTSQTARKFVTHGRPRAKVTLKVGSTRLDKLRIPALCAAPEVLPDTGLRATSR
ncbi:prealbumin-like fold domain-containing protein [Nocardioides sp. GCM10028917]|uniref:prealbumin-like fold domain-containing protein n=1 Tax=Nocardioides sp. GCM10028917 TaxID=3273408 RepID=UPI00366E994B